MSDDINRQRRHFLGGAAGSVAAIQLGLVRHASAKPAHLAAIKPGTNTSFPTLKQIDAGVLNVGDAETGPADGPPVILLHGWPYDIHSYVDVAPLLSSAGYRVIVLYLRGYGTTRFLSGDTVRNGQQSVVRTTDPPVCWTGGGGFAREKGFSARLLARDEVDSLLGSCSDDSGGGTRTVRSLRRCIGIVSHRRTTTKFWSKPFPALNLSSSGPRQMFSLWSRIQKDMPRRAAGDSVTSRMENLATRHSTKPLSAATCRPKLTTTYSLATHLYPEQNNLCKHGGQAS
jgi:hypothetical protein